MNQEIQREDEIDLIALLQKVWKGRKTILKYFILFFQVSKCKKEVFVFTLYSAKLLK